jgi:hypothetical protein
VPASDLNVGEPVTISTTVDAWISQAPEAQWAQLRELRAIILSLAPDDSVRIDGVLLDEIMMARRYEAA